MIIHGYLANIFISSKFICVAVQNSGEKTRHALLCGRLYPCHQNIPLLENTWQQVDIIVCSSIHL
jgi:hypothetical protein